MSTTHKLTVIANRYRLEQRLGDGAFAEIWKATDLRDPNQSVTVKLFRPSARGLGRGDWFPLRQEMEILKRLPPHPHILLPRAVSKAAHFADEETPCLLFDHVEAINLAEWLSGATPLTLETLPDRLRVMRQVLEALAHVHRHGIVHHDLSFGNILVEKAGNKSWLIDFGSSQAEPVFETFPDGDLKPLYHPSYGHHGSLDFGFARDVYAFSMLCSLVVTGRHALTDEWQSMRPGLWSGPADPHRSLPRRPMAALAPWMTTPALLSLSDLALQCLDVDHQRRPSASDLVEQWPSLPA